ncbi:hypothetical protein BofuT4_P025410.1 [Botrytis cinerea T4]|uniref:Uncharacterized protein n=1 Tax=Botryotinia fuckeliana (strain T4) TaxID=999810 RepID=G2YEE4_BOTF4|nr:hypothetical protein BofuT4_P025410.1 [Botrytis cinerea T4]
MGLTGIIGKAMKREKQQEMPRGNGSLYVEEPKFTSKKEPGLGLEHPQPRKIEYIAAGISRAFGRMDSEVSQGNEAHRQSGANEHSDARSNTPIQQRSRPEQKAISTHISSKGPNKFKVLKKPTSKTALIRKNVTCPSEDDYGDALVAGTYCNSRPPPKDTTSSQSGLKHKTSDIQKRSPSYHGAQSSVGSGSDGGPPVRRKKTRAGDEITKSTRKQNHGTSYTKTRETPSQPPRSTRKEDNTSQQHPQALMPGPVADQHRRPTPTNMQDSRQVPGSVGKSHPTQRHSIEPPVKYSGSQRFKRDAELFLSV